MSGKLNPKSMVQPSRFFPLFLIAISSLLLGSACQGPKALARKGRKVLQKPFGQSATFGQAFTGFALYDPQQASWIYEQNSDHYFTPASNVKILTLYTALKILGDSIPALRYVKDGDRLIFQGTASPALAHPYLPADSSVFHFLTDRKEQLFFSSSNFNDLPYGPGWAWDDIAYAFQCQRSPFPFHGNSLKVNWPVGQEQPSLLPKLFEDFLEKQPGESTRVARSLLDNRFTYTQAPQENAYTRLLPLPTSDSLTIRWLAHYLQRPVALWSDPSLTFDSAQSLYTYQMDTLYRRMMLPSNNFVAEQLLMSCSQQLFGEINSRRIIEYMNETAFRQLPDPLRWRDGSGLSRYNLMTPRSIVKVLELLLNEFGAERLFELFAAGGESGTLKKWYKGKNGPYVYAKTGTMSNRHCLSGYLKTENGRLLIFSFMHNNYPGSSRPYKEEMERFLQLIADAL